MPADGSIEARRDGKSADQILNTSHLTYVYYQRRCVPDEYPKVSESRWRGDPVDPAKQRLLAPVADQIRCRHRSVHSSSGDQETNS